ncbi:MAG: hypothetical protein DHS20C16_09370 [Phycisphaerae bacterium]|nr:MAG: hypothetical protein DHS20C16_09370 [Phycisphaerae bacterium]
MRPTAPFEKRFFSAKGFGYDARSEMRDPLGVDANTASTVTGYEWNDDYSDSTGNNTPMAQW